VTRETAARRADAAPHRNRDGDHPSQLPPNRNDRRMSLIKDGLRRLKERSAKRKATRPERVRKRAEANARRIEHRRKYGSGGDLGGGVG
jgi:hypothetical protein